MERRVPILWIVGSQEAAETTARRGLNGATGTPSLTIDRSPPVATQTALIQRERRLCNGIDPLLAPVAMALTQDIALTGYFSAVTVLQPEFLPHQGAVLLAPTHRARWDALLLPYAAGRRVTGRDCRFMVTLTEMQGLQGWFLERLGCFPVDQTRPGTSSLRYAVDLLAEGHQLVVFPEGHIRRSDGPMRLHQGLARLAVLAQSQGVDVRVVPVGLGYGHSPPGWRDRAAVCFAPALRVQGEGREAVHQLNLRLAEAMQSAEEAARNAVGRPYGTP